MTSRRKGDNPDINWTPAEHELIDRLTKENLCIYFRTELLNIHKNRNTNGSGPRTRKALLRSGLINRRQMGRGYTDFTLTTWVLEYMKLKPLVKPSISHPCTNLTLLEGETIELNRRCYICGETKPISLFRSNKREALGKGYECKDCV